MTDFQAGLAAVQADSSIFSQKVITTRLTRHRKVTLAGDRLKITTPRFVTTIHYPNNTTSSSSSSSEQQQQDEQQQDEQQQQEEGTRTILLCQQGKPTIRYLTNEDEVRQVLQDEFGIPLAETVGLSLVQSRQTAESVWSQF
jgi:hypothetical protein